jgi:hypothetical protein
MDCFMDDTLDQALKNAIAAHKGGRNQDAVELFNVVLKSQPKHPDANHNLGLLAVGDFPKLRRFSGQLWTLNRRSPNSGSVILIH